MIPYDLIAKGFDIIQGKGLDWLKTIVGEVDKHRLIDYGEKRVENKNFKELNRLCDDGLAVRRRAESDFAEHGVPEDDKYQRK